MRSVTVALALWMFGQGDSAATLDTVLERFRTYFSHYAEQYSATLALEHYNQTFTNHNGANEDYRRLDQPFAIALESEFAIMRLTATRSGLDSVTCVASTGNLSAVPVALWRMR
jgi:hypothetical protein